MITHTHISIAITVGQYEAERRSILCANGSLIKLACCMHIFGRDVISLK